MVSDERDPFATDAEKPTTSNRSRFFRFGVLFPACVGLVFCVLAVVLQWRVHGPPIKAEIQMAVANRQQRLDRTYQGRGWPLTWWLITDDINNTTREGGESNFKKEYLRDGWPNLAVDLGLALILVVAPWLLSRWMVKKRFQFNLRELLLAMFAIALMMAMIRFDSHYTRTDETFGIFSDYTLDENVSVDFHENVFYPASCFAHLHDYPLYVQIAVWIGLGSGLFLGMQGMMQMVGKFIRKTPTLKNSP